MQLIWSSLVFVVCRTFNFILPEEDILERLSRVPNTILQPGAGILILEWSCLTKYSEILLGHISLNNPSCTKE
jgi:hypothetical protein